MGRTLTSFDPAQRLQVGGYGRDPPRAHSLARAADGSAGLADDPAITQVWQEGSVDLAKTPGSPSAMQETPQHLRPSGPRGRQDIEHDTLDADNQYCVPASTFLNKSSKGTPVLPVGDIAPPDRCVCSIVAPLVLRPYSAVGDHLGCSVSLDLGATLRCEPPFCCTSSCTVPQTSPCPACPMACEQD